MEQVASVSRVVGAAFPGRMVAPGAAVSGAATKEETARDPSKSVPLGMGLI